MDRALPVNRDGPRRTLVIALMALGAAMISVQFGAAFAKTLMRAVGAPGVASLRVGLAPLLLSPLLIGTRAPVPRPRGTRAWLWGYGLSLGCMNGVFYLAISRIPIGVAVALEFMGPLALSLVAARRASERIWIAPAALGVGLLTPLNAAGLSAVDPLGAAMALIAGVFWALYIVCGQRAGAVLGRRATVLGAFIAALVVAPVGLALSGGRAFDPGVLARGAGVALLASAVPYSLEMAALTRLPARLFSILMSLEPVVAAIMAFLVLGERLDGRQLMGIAAVILASAGAAAGARTPVHPDPL